MLTRDIDLKTVNVHTVEDYFNLPKKERSWMGLYLKPMSLRCSGHIFDSNEGGYTFNFLSEWDNFSQMIRKEYPIQGYFREWFFTVDNPVYFFIWKIWDNAKDLYYNLKRLIWPVAPRFRKVAPRWRYDDVCEIIREVNFALILDFWHEEVVDGCVDWTSDEYHKKFYDWLKSSVEYIETGRKTLLDELNASYDLPDKYATTNRLEDVLRVKDEAILIQMMKYRERFWS